MASMVRVKGSLETLRLVVQASVNHLSPKIYEMQPGSGRVLTVWVPLDQYLWTLSDIPTEAEFLVAFPFAHRVDQITP